MNKAGRILIPTILSAVAAIAILASCKSEAADNAPKDYTPERLIPTVTEADESNNIKYETLPESFETEPAVITTAEETEAEETLPQTPPDRNESLALGLCDVFDSFEVGNNALTERQIEYLSAHSEFYFGKHFTVYGIFEKVLDGEREYCFVLVGINGYSRAFAVILPGAAEYENGARVVMSGRLVRHTGEDKSHLCYALSVEQSQYAADYTEIQPEFTAVEALEMIVASDVTYICSAPDMSSVIAEIPQGERLTVHKVSDYWYEVEYNGKSGYFVPRSSIDIEKTEETQPEDDLSIPKNRTFDPPRTMYIVAYALKIRSTPDFDSADNVVGYFHEGDEISVIGELEEGFYIVKYNGSDCYIGRSYASDNKQ